jgi:protein phosphatase
MTIAVPELSIVVLVGPSGSGKSTFAARHFAPTEILSSDRFRALVGDDENDQSVTREAFQALHVVADKRLALGRLTVIDATNVDRGARRPLVELAVSRHVIPVAIVLDLPERVCLERNRERPERDFGPHVVRRQRSLLHRSIGGLRREGFRRVFVLRTPEETEQARIERERSWSDRSDLRGPFDVVGDVHGCHAELIALLERLGYVREDGVFRHPAGRTAVFVGDLVDRGPATPDVLRTVMAMVEAGSALCVPGNHEHKLVRALRGRDVQVAHGLGETLAQLGSESPEFRSRVETFLDGLVSHLVLDARRLVVAHAGMREEMQGRASAAVRAFALFGETTGETDEFGLPVRYPWAEDYRGAATVVYGHTPVPEPAWVNDTICVDTGCVFGGALTALRYPERELVSVPAARTYYEPIRPLAASEPAPDASAGRIGDVLDLEDVTGKRIVETSLHGRVTIPEEHAAAALEVMSRFAVDPRWLVYLPPTMAPPATTTHAGLLEHPDEAFAEYRRAGVDTVVCEEKHMGSRAIAVVAPDPGVVRRRFGVGGVDRAGIVYTRTGRPFFADAALERALLTELAEAIGATGLWQELATDWLVLDTEIMPWSLKADALLREQYAAVGAAATAALEAVAVEAERAAGRGVDVDELASRSRERLALAERFRDAYRRYAWPVSSVHDLRVAPFQVLAGEAGTFLDRDHAWHLGIAERLARAADVVSATPMRTVELASDESRREATAWWETLTASGGEGIVVKPRRPIVRGGRGVVQPGIKVRGPEYLRIIYGPEYTAPENLNRLRERGLGRKRSLALREFALGVEALERFTRGEPRYRVHECVFGVLALESEPVDPRL